MGEQIDPGEKRRLFLRAGESFAGSGIDIPVLVVRGAAHGPTLCLTAGVHGDELNGIEIVRQLFEKTSSLDLKGMLLGYPVVNLHGFRASSRYLPDRRDLNRYFPGNPNGSSASRIANAVFRTLVDACDALVDFHTGSFHRTNLPQIRADLSDERVLALAQAFGVGVVVHSYGMRGTLRRSASEADLPSITYEAGEPMRFAQQEITYGVEGLRNLMASLGMLAKDTPEHAAEVYRRSRWVRVNAGGIFLTTRAVGAFVEEGDLLGTVTDPVTNDRSTLRAPFDGRIIGMALPQVVIPGFATFHLGLREPNGDHEEGEATLSPDELDAVEEPE
jgi:predicted deacylase